MHGGHRDHHQDAFPQDYHQDAFPQDQPWGAFHQVLEDDGEGEDQGEDQDEDHDHGEGDEGARARIRHYHQSTATNPTKVPTSRPPQGRQQPQMQASLNDGVHTQQRLIRPQ
jgi:hypothetical protein